MSKKPHILYHASPDRNIQRFEPRKEHIRSADDGPVVFATSNKAYASAFLVRWDDSWAHLSSHNGLVLMAISDKERFLRSDRGGAIYELPSDDFENVSPTEDHPEWKSATAVTPSGKTEYASTLDAMIENGVQVYFVDRDAFEKIRTADDFGLSILSALVSENQKRGMGARSVK
ncbi:MAG: hypothetical protein KGI79_02070 [Patescibacteria group bacterium]|nr:hypothetical protein [Patescibacteria group bacterium]MDE2116637.1 hypothetical protein [Patescibacteria group bacterium]